MKKIILLSLFTASLFAIGNQPPMMQQQKQMQVFQKYIDSLSFEELQNKMNKILDFKENVVVDLRKCVNSAKTKQELFKCRPKQPKKPFLAPNKEELKKILKEK